MNDLKDLDTKISETEKAIVAEQKRQPVILTGLGRAIYESDNKNEVSEDCLDAVSKVFNAIQEHENALNRAQEIQDRYKQIDEKQQATNVELRNLKNKENDSLKELGHAAWDVWKSGQPIVGLEDALADLIKADKRVHNADKAMDANKNIYKDSIVTKSRNLLLAGRRRTATVIQDRLWSRAGSTVAKNIPLSEFEETTAAEVVRLFETLIMRQKEMEEDLKSLKEEKDKLNALLNKLPGKGNVRKRTTWTEKALENEQSHLDDALQALAQSWLGQHTDKAMATDVGKWKAEWDGVSSAISRLEEEKKVLNVFRDYRIAEQKRDQQAIRVADLDAALKARQAHLKSAQKELTILEKEVAKCQEKLPKSS